MHDVPFTIWRCPYCPGDGGGVVAINEAAMRDVHSDDQPSPAPVGRVRVDLRDPSQRNVVRFGPGARPGPCPHVVLLLVEAWARPPAREEHLSLVADWTLPSFDHRDQDDGLTEFAWSVVMSNDGGDKFRPPGPHQALRVERRRHAPGVGEWLLVLAWVVAAADPEAFVVELADGERRWQAS